MSDAKYIQISVSCASEHEAESLVKYLLSHQLVACGQILNNMKSFYRWQGHMSCSEECLLILKSKASLFDAVERAIRKQHSYDVPEIIATPLVAISEPYKKWIDEETI